MYLVVVLLVMLASSRALIVGSRASRFATAHAVSGVGVSRVSMAEWTSSMSGMQRWMSAGAAGEDTVVARCTQKIQEALNPSKLIVQAAHDDPNGSHISVEVVSELFEGKRSVQRQRLVYQAIWDEMKDGGAVHAVDQIIAQTPAESGGD